MVKDSIFGVLSGLAAMIEEKHPHLAGHSQRVARWAGELARAAGLSPAEAEELRRAALIHDIGLAGIDDRLLSRAGGLEPEDQAIYDAHTQLAVQLLINAAELKPLCRLIAYHHHPFDGGGSRECVHGERLPLGSRILAVLEAYDGYLNPPAGQGRLGPEDAIARLEGRAGEFDQKLVGLLKKLDLGSGGARRVDERQVFIDRLKAAFRNYQAGSNRPLPVKAAVAERLGRELGAAKLSFEALSQAVMEDPSLVLKLISVANSPGYASRTPILSISQALSRIGLTESRHLIAGHMEFNRFFTDREPFAGMLAAWWRRSYLSAQAASQLSTLAREFTPDAAFLLGLIHQAGYASLLVAFKDIWQAGELSSDQVKLLGNFISLYHPQAGVLLAKEAGLPDAFTAAIAQQNRKNPQDMTAGALLLGAAGELVRLAESGQAGPQPTPGPFCQGLGLKEAQLKSIVARLRRHGA